MADRQGLRKTASEHAAAEEFIRSMRERIAAEHEKNDDGHT